MTENQSAADKAFRRGHKLMVLTGSEPCIGRTHLFFPNRTRPAQAARQVRQAKALCKGCDRRLECLAGADLRREPAGIWGGVDFQYRWAPPSTWADRTEPPPDRHKQVRVSHPPR